MDFRMRTVTVLDMIAEPARRIRVLRPIVKIGRTGLQRALGRHLLTASLGGVRLGGNLEHRDYIRRLLGNHEDMHPWMTRLLLDALVPGAVFVDVGAYIGLFAILGAKRVGPSGRVYAFEPDPRNYPALVKNIMLNGLQGRVEARQCAAADEAGVRRLFLGAGSQTGSSLQQWTVCDGQVQVECVVLDDLLHKIESVDVVKIDVEGAEVQVLRGMRRLLDRSPRAVLFCELNGPALAANGFTPADLLETLSAQGFKVLVANETEEALEAPEGQWDRKPYVNLVCRR